MKPVAALVRSDYSTDIAAWYRKLARYESFRGARIARIFIGKVAARTTKATFYSPNGDVLAWGEYTATPQELADHFKRARALRGVEIEVHQ